MTKSGAPSRPRDAGCCTSATEERGGAGSGADLGARLRDPRCFGPEVEQVELVETHISWVLLTGAYAYKVHKPVVLPFLDFGTVEARRRDCEAELRLNRRLAPDLYLEVVPITGSRDAPRIGVPGPIVDYALKMRQFPAANQLDRVLAAGRLTEDHIDSLAADLAAFHARAGLATTDSRYASRERIATECMDNFRVLEAAPLEAADQNRLRRLQDWTERSLADHAELFSARRAAGWVRECHGDLHLANIALIEGRPVPFDCLEFDPDLRWIDTMSETAFLMMDLFAHHRADLAWRFLDAYLERSGDYAGIALLRHYLVYRCLVRAKVDAIRLSQAGRGHDEQTHQLKAQLALAERLAEAPAETPLIITHGLSGSGKSWLSARLLAPLGAIRVRSDTERRRLDCAGSNRYGAASSRKTYARLQETAQRVLNARYPVILDATFLNQAARGQLRAMAARLNVPFRILSVHAPHELLKKRVIDRAESENDPSEATPEVIERQRTNAEALSPSERATALVVDTSRPVDVATLVKEIAAAPPPQLRSVADAGAHQPPRRNDRDG